MLWLGLFVLLVMSLSHWLFEPLLHWGTPLFQLKFGGWLVLAFVVWAFAGGRRRIG